MIIPAGIKNIPPIVGVPCLRIWFLGPSVLIICLILNFFNLGIPIKVIIEDTSVVNKKGTVKLLFGKYKSKEIQEIDINPNKINICLLISYKNDDSFLSKIFLDFSKT